MTKQREAIYQIIYNSHAHLTAEEIFSLSKEQGLNLVFATVYNSIKYLEEQGLIRRISIANSLDRFDGNMHPHDHFVCVKCGRLIDVPATNNINTSQIDGHKIHGYEIVYNGTCEDCLKKENIN